ncbi:MAG: tetratricopeptide repeat protein [Candidatus Thorarchaeota archaeon]
MPRHLRDKISRAEELLSQGEFQQALKIVDLLNADQDMELIERLQVNLLESQIRVKMGEFERAEQIIDAALESSGNLENTLLIADLLLTKLEISWRSGKLEDGLLLVKELEEMLLERESIDNENELEMKKRRGQLNRHCGILSWYKGDLDRATECHEQSLEVCQDLDDKTGIANALNNLGLVQWSKGNLDAAAEYYEESLAIWEEEKAYQSIGVILNNLGNVYALKGDLQRALDYHKRALRTREEYGNKPETAMSLVNVGSVHQTLGNLNQALEYYHRALVIFEEVEVKQTKALALNNLGSAYQLRGDLSQSLEFHQRSLEMRRELGNNQDIAQSLLNIGEIHQVKGEIKQALDNYQQSLELYKESGNDTYTAVAYYMIINTATESSQFDIADAALTNLDDLNKNADNRVIDQRYRVAKAIRLKASGSAREKLRAQEILAEVVEEEIGAHALTVTAMVHLCDLLMFELKMTGEELLFTRARDTAQQILDIAKSQTSYTLMVEAYILQSKFALVEQDIEKARILLGQAHIMTQEKGLYRLARKVAHERDLLQLQLDKWQKIIEQNPSRMEMIDFAQLDNYLERMIKKTVDVLTKDEKKEFGDEAARRKYKLTYIDLLERTENAERSKFRVGIAQIGLSQKGDILGEYYEEIGNGLLAIQKDRILEVFDKVKEVLVEASEKGVNVLLFPEMSIDLNYPDSVEGLVELAKGYQMYIIPGSFHEEATKQNICRVIGPEGVLWEQAKHTPAIIHLKGKRFTEGIDVGHYPRNTIVCNTQYGRMAIVICRDFLDMDLRVELKNFDPPVDLVLNPAFTPVTADFDAAHFDARRSIYAYCFFANVAEFGDSLIYTPEKDRTERTIPAGEERIIYKDVDLFQLRSERKKWERERKSFIQSTK